jgi:hypothetical protein
VTRAMGLMPISALGALWGPQNYAALPCIRPVAATNPQKSICIIKEAVLSSPPSPDLTLPTSQNSPITAIGNGVPPN